jgi:DNA invertase Pin-like site-specific DNA recombinase
MKVVVYVRVSTGKQVQEGLGLADQERACRAWARQHGHQIMAVFRDEGVSGTRELEDRLGLAEALAAVKEGRAGAILVYRLDRLARDLVLQEQLLAEAWRSGELFSTAGGEANLHDDPEDPSRRLIRQVLGAVSEYERAIIALRLRRGRAAKAARGGFAYGSPAYGHRADGRALIPDEREQATIARARELHAGGASLRRIGAILEAEGHRPKRGSRWHPTAVARVLKRSS